MTTDPLTSDILVRQLIMQPTSFCNIDCRYCYIPAALRTQKNGMSLETAKSAIEAVLNSGMANAQLEIRWHDGEPLVRGVEFYREIFAWAQATAADEVNLHHSIQTNGMLLNDDWVDLFESFNVTLGVSIDGPAILHDANRIDRSGRGTHEKVMAGLHLLKDRKFPFDVICVVGLGSLDHASLIAEFFQSIRPRNLALNVEDYLFEALGQEVVSEKLRSFMAIMFEEWKRGLIIREFEDMNNRIAAGEVRSMTAEPMSIVSVSVSGDFSTFSPELMTLPGEIGARFIFGNVRSNNLREIVSSEHFIAVSKEVRAGVELCRQTCDYFSVCGGGTPANKFFETGRLDVTETLFCKVRIKQVADLILDSPLTKSSLLA